MGIGIRNCKRGVPGELPFNDECGFKKPWSDEKRAHLLANLRRLKGSQRRNGGNGREEIRIRDHVLLLKDPVAAKRRHRICQAEAIIEGSESGADYGLRARGPRDADARSEIMP